MSISRLLYLIHYIYLSLGITYYKDINYCKTLYLLYFFIFIT